MAESGRTALYRLFDVTGQLLYIGISGNPDVRFGQHAGTKDWWGAVVERKIEWFNTRDEAVDAERAAIRSERPVWNSKHSIYYGISSETEALFEEFRRTREERIMLLAQVKALAPDLMRKGATIGQLAKWTGLTDEVFRRIGRAHNIDRLREPTVGKNAKPKAEKE